MLGLIITLVFAGVVALMYWGTTTVYSLDTYKGSANEQLNNYNNR